MFFIQGVPNPSPPQQLLNKCKQFTKLGSLFIRPKKVNFNAIENFLVSPKLVCGEGRGDSKVLHTNTHQVISIFKSIDRNMKTVQASGIFLNPIQNDGQLNFTSFLNLTGYHFGYHGLRTHLRIAPLFYFGVPFTKDVLQVGATVKDVQIPFRREGYYLLSLLFFRDTFF